MPSYCVSSDKKFYQYTAIDECTRFCFREMYEEHSTYSSKDFLMNLIKAFPFPIREVQTNNGTEWTTALLVKDKTSKTLFEKTLMKKRFYRKMRMYSLEDGRTQLARYNRKSNNIPKVCLNFRTPKEVLNDYLAVM